MPLRRGQPVSLAILSRRTSAGVQREGTVIAAHEILALRAEREAVQRIRMKKVFRVVQRHRPEAADGWFLARSKTDFVRGTAVERGPRRISISVEVLRLVRIVVKD